MQVISENLTYDDTKDAFWLNDANGISHNLCEVTAKVIYDKLRNTKQHALIDEMFDFIIEVACGPEENATFH
jgi:hypothetical protein